MEVVTAVANPVVMGAVTLAAMAEETRVVVVTEIVTEMQKATTAIKLLQRTTLSPLLTAS